jgi:alkanesulfonate monooxygenase SsuD/methylene tetrahydromethanopterin reductase-like flavin-dependent oxidoreductase (luciferase family)
MRTLWCDEISEYHGELYDLRSCQLYPKPVQQPHPPIHVGGESKAALRRVARYGQGWYTFNRLPGDLAQPLGELDEVLAEHGRSRADIELSASPYFNAVTPDMVEQYAEQGVDRLIVICFAFDRDSMLKSIDQITTDVLARTGS